MFLEAVLPDHSLDSRGFTYFVPEHLRDSVRRGCVVEVPFGEELVSAVVTETDAPPPDRAEAKAVVSVLVPDSIVHPYQIEAAYALSKRYFVFLHTALSFFVPVPVLRRFVKAGKGYAINEGTSDFPASRPTLLYDREGRGAAKVFGSSGLPAEPGTVLILPSDAAVAAFLRDTEIPEDSFLVHLDSLTEAKDFRLRLAVAAGERPFLV